MLIETEGLVVLLIHINGCGVEDAHGIVNASILPSATARKATTWDCSSRRQTRWGMWASPSRTSGLKNCISASERKVWVARTEASHTSNNPGHVSRHNEVDFWVEVP